MTTENNRRPTRRSARAGRNRPELVTSTSMEEVKEDAPTVEDSPTLEESQQELEATAVTPRKRKLADFFSTVGRSEKAPEVQESEAAQARIARATRGKAARDGAKPEAEETKATPKASVPARPAPARPASPFKTKYLLGMVIYLFGAQFIGIYEQGFLQANHLNTVLTTFSLFGGKVIISTSTLVFLATLLLLLVVLARFDLIPRSLGALSGQQSSQARKSTSSSQGTSDNARQPQPAMKQGVSGADDDLYQEYRANQRRTRKR
jgi:hypothetical protein